MVITHQPDGTILITLDVGEEAAVRGASIHVSLDSADNTYRTPMNLDDLDEYTITAKQRRASDYPEQK